MLESKHHVAGKKQVWSKNTTYPAVVGRRPSEVSKLTNVLQKRLANAFNSDMLRMESMHRKELKNHNKAKKALETSMTAYSEKMKNVSTSHKKRFGIYNGDIKQKIVTKRSVSLDSSFGMLPSLIPKMGNMDSININGQGMRKTTNGHKRTKENTSDTSTRLRNTTASEVQLVNEFVPKKSRNKNMAEDFPVDFAITNAFPRNQPKLSGHNTNENIQSWDSLDSAYDSFDEYQEEINNVFQSEGEFSLKSSESTVTVNISPFPEIKVDEYIKHKQMNKEASRMIQPLHELSFKRPNLSKLRQEHDKKEIPAPKKDVVKGKKKTGGTKQKERKGSNGEMEDQLQSEFRPQNQRIKREKVNTMKIIHSFKYSSSVLDLYGINEKEEEDELSANPGELELKNGWYIKCLGGEVLTVDTRLLPSRRHFLRPRVRQLPRPSLSRSDPTSISSSSLRPLIMSMNPVENSGLQQTDHIPSERNVQEAIKEEDENVENSGPKNSDSKLLLPDIVVSRLPSNPPDEFRLHSPKSHSENCIIFPMIAVES
ncbi:hypothetical protein CHS0354_029342 [Potamilus streckersoni]|uniref:Uncharacterized protein n=1 Tax=Potamilus streckersoni TaxID=2493646 RepID=A0AAE0T2X1_9BIVA|nr:hypothetical protein CHS0354_029342 [Potamilus streckersoni]